MEAGRTEDPMVLPPRREKSRCLRKIKERPRQPAYLPDRYFGDPEPS